MAKPKSPGATSEEQKRAELYSTSLSNDITDLGNYAQEYFNLGEEEAFKNLEQANPQPTAVKEAKKFDANVKGFFADKIRHLSDHPEPTALVRKKLIWSQFYQDYLNTKDRDPRLAYENAKAKILRDPEFKNDRAFQIELSNRAEQMKPKPKKGTYKGEFQQSNDLLFSYRNTSRVRLVRVLKDSDVKSLVESSLSNLVKEHLSLDLNRGLNEKVKKNENQEIILSTDLEVSAIMNGNSHNPALDLAYKDSADWGARGIEAESQFKAEFNRYSNYFLPKNDEESTKKFFEFLDEKRKAVINSPVELSPTEIIEWIRAAIKDSSQFPEVNSVKRLALRFSKKIKEQEANPELGEAMNEILKKIRMVGTERSTFDLKTGSEILEFAYSKFLPVKENDDTQQLSIRKECRLLLNGKSCATVEMAISEIKTKRYFRDVQLMLSREIGQITSQVNKQLFPKGNGIVVEREKGNNLKDKYSTDNLPKYSSPDSIPRMN